MRYRAQLTLAFVMSLIVAQVIDLWWGLPTFASQWPLRCPINFLFGWSCPTCGFGRALIYAWLGQWQTSWHYHPLGVIVLLMMVLLLALAWIKPHAPVFLRLNHPNVR